MRISTKRLKQRRLKIIQARKEGASYSELQRRFGVSPNYLSKLFKGKDINKYCEQCGENDPQVLEKHHPDKENRPNSWIWLCSNCHSKISRKEIRKRIKQRSVPGQFPIPQKTSVETQVIAKPPAPSFEYGKLSIGEKIAFWAMVAGIPSGIRIITYLRKRKKQKLQEQKQQELQDIQRRIQKLLKRVKNLPSIS